MTTTEHAPPYYTCKVISECFTDDAKREKFMQLYRSDPTMAQGYLQELGMPEVLAAEVIGKQGDALNAFIGKNVCDYLW